MAMFQIKRQLTFERTVKVRVPSSKDASRVEEFTGVFRVLPDDEMAAALRLIPYLQAGATPDPEEAGELLSADPVDEVAARSPMQGVEFELLRRVWVGWSGVADPDGDGSTPWTWSPEAREELLRWPYIRSGVMSAYHDAIMGKKVARGN